MSITRTLGGNRLGSGKKQKVHMHGYSRSTHDLSYVFRSTMASGTLVPFLTEVGLPGDTFDIDLSALMHTHPTIGPLFGTYKVQLDLFQIPIRLYNGKLHMNMLGIGLDMEQIKFPLLEFQTNKPDVTRPLDNQQINPSCILSYLNIRGAGFNPNAGQTFIQRYFNAIPFLAYWDIYKNYYANKQEEIGVVIHRPAVTPSVTLASVQMVDTLNNISISVVAPGTPQEDTLYPYSTMVVTGTNIGATFNADNLILTVSGGFDIERHFPASRVWQNMTINASTATATFSDPDPDFLQGTLLTGVWNYHLAEYINTLEDYNAEPVLQQFPLSNIDQMRMDILADVNNTSAFLIGGATADPYGLPLKTVSNGTDFDYRAATWGQEGLALKTYQSDLFNNWVTTEWIDGEDGISEITKVDTTDGGFTIDELNIANKIYEMLMRIAVSGGSYDDWLDTVYDHDRYKKTENPIYCGGLIKELTFEEVVSQAEAPDNAPLGTLAGKGFLGNKNKGGSAIIRIDEPSYVMGIVSLTPRIDYSQGNKWDTTLLTMNDLHKPQLDAIGFQDLLTDQMAWWDTISDQAGVTTYRSAGKQPAWINYMTNVNIIRGNFALENEQMFMVLNRRYEPKVTGTDITIGDLTTYIDPKKHNHIFANARRDAQNFWIQIGVKMTVRRKMSAKVIPNL